MIGVKTESKPAEWKWLSLKLVGVKSTRMSSSVGSEKSDIWFLDKDRSQDVQDGLDLPVLGEALPF